MFTSCATHRRRWASCLCLVGVLLLDLLAPAHAGQQDGTHRRSTGVHEVRSIWLQPFDLARPAAFAFAPEDGTFVILDTGMAGATKLAAVTMYRETAGQVTFAPAFAGPLNAVFEPRTGRVLAFDGSTGRLFELVADPAAGVARVDRTWDFRYLGIQDPRGMAIGPAGRLFILDAAAPRIVAVQWATPGTPVDIIPIGVTDPRGLAFNRANRHLYVLAPAEQRLYELTAGGQIVSSSDVTELHLDTPEGMLFAPSADTTDDPAREYLFVLDSGRRTTGPGRHGGPRIVELYFDSQLQTATLAAELSATTVLSVTPALVRVVPTSLWSPPSPDPSGIAYLPYSGTLLISDGEVDEIPALFTGKNMYEASREGYLLDTFTTIAYSYEPTGVAYDDQTLKVFTSDDNRARVFEVDLGGDQRFGTSDDTVHPIPTRPSGSTKSALNCVDAEGVAYDSRRRMLFVADGSGREVWKVMPGNNGVFDGAIAGSDDVISSFDTEVFVITDPESVEFNPEKGTLFLTTRGTLRHMVWEVTTDGAVVRTFDIRAAGVKAPAGIAYAPGSTNALRRSLYIVDRGVDNNSNPDENDGRMFEFDIGWGPPDAPTDLSALITGGDVQLAWVDTATTEESYLVERAVNGGAFVEIATLGADAMAFTDTTASVGDALQYRVRASNANAFSAYSNVALPASGVPEVPTNVTATSVSSTQINVSWDASSGATNYRVERSQDGEATWAIVMTTSATAITDSGLTPGTTYSYRVTAINAYGESAPSASAVATTVANPPPAPTGVSATAVSSSRIDVAWTASPGAESYRVERSSDGGSTWTAVASTTATNVSDTGLSVGTTYMYRVVAINSDGESPPSLTASATTISPPTAPSGLTAAAISPSQIVLAWNDNSADELGFVVERSLDGVAFTTLATLGVNTTGYADAGLTATTTYHYRVRAYKFGADSAYSNTASATTMQPPPAAPTNLSAVALSSSQIGLQWTDNATNEDGFEIQRALVGRKFSTIATVGQDTTVYTDSGLLPATIYRYRVRAYNGSGTSAYSNIARRKTMP